MNNTKFLSTTVLLSALLSGAHSYASAEQETVTYNGHQLAITKTALGNDESSAKKPTLLMLSGPTDNWHSDSAWWILSQNYLAKHFNTITLDRAGHVGTPYIDKPSYQTFSQDLAAFLHDQENEVIILAFASSNLAVQPMLADSSLAEKVKGVVLIDADVLTPHGIKHYSEETEGYRTGWDGLEAYIKLGKYDDRLTQKIAAERKHLKELITAELAPYMDWIRYDAIEKERATREFQIYKFKEATNYLSDLKLAEKKPFPSNIPLVVIDTDFESTYLETIESEAVKKSISQWQSDGTQWYSEIAERSECGVYWPVESREHLLTMEQPELLLKAVENIMSCTKKGAQ